MIHCSTYSVNKHVENWFMETSLDIQKRVKINWADIGMSGFVDLSLQKEHLVTSTLPFIIINYNWNWGNSTLCSESVKAVSSGIGLTQQGALMFTDKKTLEYLTYFLIRTLDRLLNMMVEYLCRGRKSLSYRFGILFCSASLAKVFQVLLSQIHTNNFILGFKH